MEKVNENSNYKRYIHYDRDIEMTVLGSILIERNAFAKCVGIVDTDCFYYEENKFIFSVLKEMWNNSYPIDLHTVLDKCAKKDYAKITQYELPYYLCKCTTPVCATNHLQAHCLAIRQMFIERELLRVQTQLLEGEDTLAKIAELQQELNKLMLIKSSDDWQDMVDIVLEVHKHMDEVKDKELIGIPTGFRKLDLVTGGFAKTNMIVLAARPSVGKSALLNTMALYQAKLGYNVGIISLEMPNVQIGARLGALAADMEFYKIFRNKIEDEKERDIMYYEFEKLANLPIKISDKTGINVHDIKAKASQLVHRKQLDILYIDYLQLVEGESTKTFSREQEVSKLSRGIKLMAMEFEIPIVVLAQLNRESEKTGNKKPQLHHLRESGAIEQDADGVIFLHRDFKVGIETDAEGKSTENEADLIVAKWRNGETREIKIGYTGTKMKFYDFDAPRGASRNYYEKETENPF